MELHILRVEAHFTDPTLSSGSYSGCHSAEAMGRQRAHSRTTMRLAGLALGADMTSNVKSGLPIVLHLLRSLGLCPLEEAEPVRHDG